MFTHFSENDIQQGKRNPDGGEKEEVEHTMGKEKYPLSVFFNTPFVTLEPFFLRPTMVIMNVDRNRMLSLTVKVSSSYFHFQKSRENPYYEYYELVYIYK